MPSQRDSWDLYTFLIVEHPLSVIPSPWGSGSPFYDPRQSL